MASKTKAACLAERQRTSSSRLTSSWLTGAWRGERHWCPGVMGVAGTAEPWRQAVGGLVPADLALNFPGEAESRARPGDRGCSSTMYIQGSR